VNSVHAKGLIIIKSETPLSLRSQLYGYLAALRSTGTPEIADAILITTDPPRLKPRTPGSVILSLRDSSRSAQEILSALSQSEESHGF
jgi:hypothetical protein